MQVQFIAGAQNAKTGPIPASIVERASCWSGCALYENGCYAEAGALAMHWDRVSRGVAGASWSEFCAKVAALRLGRLWRYAQAGDLPGYGPQIDGTLLEEVVAANARQERHRLHPQARPRRRSCCDTSGKWCGNALRFATREEAETNVRNLMMRWFAVRETRIVVSDDPVELPLRRRPARKPHLGGNE